MVRVYGVYEVFYGRLLFSRCCRLVCSARALRGKKKKPLQSRVKKWGCACDVIDVLNSDWLALNIPLEPGGAVSQIAFEIVLVKKKKRLFLFFVKTLVYTYFCSLLLIYTFFFFNLQLKKT